MIFICFPLAGVLKLPLSKITFSFTLHFIVPPLSFVVRAFFLKLVATLSMLLISFFLTNVLTPYIFVINLMNFLKLLRVNVLSFRSTSKFAIVATVYWHTWVIRAYVVSMHTSSRIAPWSNWIPASACTLADTPWIIAQVHRIWTCHW